jgi:hypothetical protein
MTWKTLFSFKESTSIVLDCSKFENAQSHVTSRADVFRKEPQDRQKQPFILNFIPLRTNFEEEAAIFTTSAIHQWKALVKPEF